MTKMNLLDYASWIGCTIAAVHLGLIGAFELNLLGILGPTIEEILYIAIGLLGVYSIYHMLTHKK